MDKPRHSSDSSIWEEQKLLKADSLDPHEVEEAPHILTASQKHTFRWQPRSIAIGFITGLAFAAILISLLYAVLQPTTHKRIKPPISGTDPSSGKPAAWFGGECGNSSSEALHRGCHFDMISFAWQKTPACFSDLDAADEVEFMALQDWRWFLKNGTEVSVQEIQEGQFRYVFTSFEWHLAHCTFLWRKMHRALFSGGMLDSYVASYEHTMHCGKMLRMEVKPGETLLTRVWIKYPKCGG